MLDLGPHARFCPILRPLLFVNPVLIAVATLRVVLRPGRALLDHLSLSAISTGLWARICSDCWCGMLSSANPCIKRIGRRLATSVLSGEAAKLSREKVLNQNNKAAKSGL